MITFLIIAASFILLIFGMRFFIMQKAKAKVGKPISEETLNSSYFSRLKGKKGLIYFFTPTCPNCVTQKPVIDNLKKKKVNVLEIDLSKKRELAAEFGIMGVPSTVLINGNTINDIMIGPRDEGTLWQKYSAMG